MRVRLDGLVPHLPSGAMPRARAAARGREEDGFAVPLAIAASGRASLRPWPVPGDD